MTPPHWLPPLMPQEPYESFPHYEDRIYEVFRQDFIDSHPSFKGLQVNVRRQQQEDDGKWAGFVHMTSHDDHIAGDRVPDLPRCERIRFPRQLIEHYLDCPICHYTICEKPLAWWSERHGRRRIQILMESERYLVVLEPHPEKNYCLLVTAYCVDHDHSYHKLLKDYERAVSERNAI